MDDDFRIVRKKDLFPIIGLKRTAIEDLIARGDFPMPVRIGKRAKGFVLSEIKEWLRKRVAERDEAQ